jgi:hypothetical protein
MTQSGHPVREKMKDKSALFATLIFLGGCCATQGEIICAELQQVYWRIDTQGPDGKWKTNWTSWFETEEACLKGLNENQRCRKRLM